MTPRANTGTVINRILLGLAVVIFFYMGYSVYMTHQLMTTTGIVDVTTDEPNAAITISQVDKQAEVLGMDHVRARLKPGSYIVAATLDGNVSKTTVVIKQGYTTTKKINPVNVTVPKSTTGETGFVNFDALSSQGLSDDQISYLQELFSDFDDSARTVAVDATTTLSAPHDPNSDDPFAITFNVMIDKTVYKATIQYSDDESIRLFLYNQAGAQVYSGFAPSSSDT